MRYLWILTVLFGACADDRRPSGTADAGTDGPNPDVELVCGGADFQSDPENCGECGYSCGGGACSMGRCLASQFATDQLRPSSVATDGVNVVWTSAGVPNDATGQIATCAVAGCDSSGPRVIYDNQAEPRAIILQGDEIFFIKVTLSNESGSVQTLSPFWASIHGTTDTFLPVLHWSFPSVNAIAAQGDLVFFSGADRSSGMAGQCRKIGCPTASYTQLNPTASSGIAADLEHAFYTEVESARILRSTHSGLAEPEALFEAQIAAVALRVDDTHLYWGTALDDQPGLTVQNYVARGPKAGGELERLVEVAQVVDLVVDETHVYFLDAAGTIGRVAKTGGEPEIFAEHDDARGIAVGGGYLFWARERQGTILRLRLPPTS